MSQMGNCSSNEEGGCAGSETASGEKSSMAEKCFTMEKSNKAIEKGLAEYPDAAEVRELVCLSKLVSFIRISSSFDRVSDSCRKQRLGWINLLSFLPQLQIIASQRYQTDT